MANIQTPCLILAAGNGRRIMPHSGGIPKPLVHLHGVPLLEHVLLSAKEAGIRRFVIVIGCRGGGIRQWLAARNSRDIDVTYVENPDYHKDNGVSVLAARDYLSGPFLLVMSDHIFEPATARAMITRSFGRDHVILGVDSNIGRVFDLDDATKVRRDGDHIVDIGKNLTHYDALDTGMFYCRPSLFGTLESAMTNGNCSLSDGMRKLSQRGLFRAFDIGDAHWQDVDTPEALAYAEATFTRDFGRTPVAGMLTRAA
ncbi:MAG: NTP transferase domain-containing protein [Acidobacteriaceae bacterium]|nr:NTP transferase domain-containing protein [Acidobacteriaceae bacterium]